MTIRPVVDVFPITTGAFGLRSDWFNTVAPRLVGPSILLMILFLLISIGVMTLKRFEDSDLEKKLWNIPIILTVVLFWPYLVLTLKDLVDTFNTFLVQDIFQMTWQGFGFSNLGSITNIMGWSAEALARLIPNLAYWIVYAFYIIFFFFFALLGPFILAKGILFDEIDAFLEIVRELTILFLWQTTTIILVAFIMPDIVSGQPLPPNPHANFYFLSLILGIMLFFVPSITRKFGNHLGGSFVPLGMRLVGTTLGLAAIGAMSTASLAAAGVATQKFSYHWNVWRHRLINTDELLRTYHDKREIEALKRKSFELQAALTKAHKSESTHKKTNHDSSSFLEFSRRANKELYRFKNRGHLS